jgi:hypothetical protein
MSNKIQHNGGWFSRPEHALLVYIPPGFYDVDGNWDDLILYRISFPALNHLIDYVKREMPQCLVVKGIEEKQLINVIDRLFDQNNKMLDVIKILSNGEPLK